MKKKLLHSKICNLIIFIPLLEVNQLIQLLKTLSMQELLVK
jgi:hypothetical protein